MSSQAEVMNQVRALTLASQAVDHLLTGAPALDTFDADEVGAASDLLFEQMRARKKARLGAHPDQVTFDTARSALYKIRRRLIWRRLGRLGPRKARLEAAAAALPAMIARIEAEYNAYWQDLTESALTEAEAILAAALCEAER